MMPRPSWQPDMPCPCVSGTWSIPYIETSITFGFTSTSTENCSFTDKQKGGIFALKSQLSNDPAAYGRSYPASLTTRAPLYLIFALVDELIRRASRLCPLCLIPKRRTKTKE